MLRKIALSAALALSLLGTAQAAEPAAVMPRYVMQPEPHYPESMRSTGKQGKVMVRVLIARNGLPIATRIEVSSGQGPLDNEAVRAVRRAEWEPIPEPVWVNVPINFELH